MGVCHATRPLLGRFGDDDAHDDVEKHHVGRNGQERRQNEEEAHDRGIPIVALGQATTHACDHAVPAAAIEAWCHRLLLLSIAVGMRYATLTMRTVVGPSGVSTTTSSPAKCPNKARPTGD